ncbi:MAG: cell division protein FtsK [Parcubacteria group bacterium SW_6_46_9]|nr:MAG: cell division protein FtsK [Parcubacteria group bacterium SW_6_46_9]
MSSSSNNNSWANFGMFAGLSSRVRSVIAGVVCVALAGLLVLAGAGAAGIAGTTIYNGLTTAVGVGYWLIIAGLFIFSGYLLSGDHELPSLSWTHAISGLLLLASVLALVSLATGYSGGVVGGAISSAVVGVFSVYAGAIVIEAIGLISLLVLFDEFIDLNKSIQLPRLSSITKSIPSLAVQGKSADSSDASVKIKDNTKTDTTDQHKSESDNKDSKKDKTDDNQSDTSTDQSKDKSADSDDYAVHDYDEAESEADTQTKLDTDTDYSPPPLSLLSKNMGSPEVGDVKARANKIKRTLQNFNITVEMDEVSIGPTVTRYALKPAEGVRLSKITNLQNNLEMALAAHPVRIEAPIPGESLVGVEVPNEEKTTVGLASLLGSARFQEAGSPLLMGLGQGISGDSFYTDLSNMPHLLIGGATGSGKSVTAHVLINNLLYRKSPEELKLIMVDPKRVELTLYDGIPHLLTPVITSAKKAILALKWAAKEMERRDDILEETGARDIQSYHNKLDDLKEKASKDEADPDPMPYIVVVIDEMADLMQAYPKDLESVIVRIAQMSRAVGIHLILSTQRPDADVVTGLIKANIPARIALQVSSYTDSQIILDEKGAEQLLGEGDMLFQSGDMSSPVRIQSAFISEDEVKSVAKHLKDQYEGKLQDTVNLTKDDEESKTIFDVAREEEQKEERDEKYEQALETVVEADKASTSYLQRKLRIGYSRAARIMDELEENGIITEKDGTKARDVLITKEQLEAAREGRLEQDNEKPGSKENKRPTKDGPAANRNE